MFISRAVYYNYGFYSKEACCFLYWNIFCYCFMSYNYQWNQILSTDKKIVLKSMANVYQYLAYDVSKQAYSKSFLFLALLY
jgi:hypothetical protein